MNQNIHLRSTWARRSGVVAVAAFASCAVLAGCSLIDGDSGGSQSSLAGRRAQYVATMLRNSYAGGPETERGIMSVITGYGGGYVTDAELTGTAGTPSEKLELDVVIGAGEILDSMQGETDMAASEPQCYSYTLGYYGYDVQAAQTSCPSTLTTAKAQATAERQIAAQVASESYGGGSALTRIPDSLRAAEAAVGFDGTTPSRTAPSGSSFAAGHDSDGKPAAGLAVPQPGGACVYVAFRSIRATSKNGTAFSVSDDPGLAAWVAPTSAPCQGPAALAAAAFLTVDTYAGG